ncbi:MAG: flippase-like domain-containing protein [bacterium]|nr:flippase-like domain-containing protein [bacterium]
MKKKHSLKIIFGILISLLFLWFVFRKIDFLEVLIHLKNLKISWLIVFIIIFLFNFALKGIRWSALTVDKYKNTLLFTRSFITGMMLNNLLPLRMGDLIRAYLVSKRLNLKKSTMFGTVVIERFFDILSLFILLSLFIVIADFEISDFIRNIAKAGIIVGLSGFIFLIILSRKKTRILEKIDSLHNINFFKKITGFIDSVIEGFDVLNHNHHIVGVAFLSLLVWLFEAFSFMMIGLAFGLELNLFAYIFLMISVCLGTLIPSGPGYVGVFEGATIGVLALFGIEKEIALAYAIVLHTIQIIVVTLAGIVCAAKEGWSMKDLGEIKGKSVQELK